MTRENKLALVVGFALILFVGILISDHFSALGSRPSADLSHNIDDPLVGNQADRPDLIDFHILNNTAQLEADQSEAPEADRTDSRATGDGGYEIFMGATTPTLHSEPETIGLNGASMGELTFTYHEIQPGESLTAIARQHFGDPSLARELASFNNIADPNNVREGRRIRIPKKPDSLLRGGNPTPGITPGNTPGNIPTPRGSTPPNAEQPTPQATPRETRTPARSQYSTYTIKSGDVLSRLAEKLLGTTKRMNELIELNRDVITNPDRLIAGKVIKVPRN